jgi:hypothetical protein
MHQVLNFYTKINSVPVGGKFVGPDPGGITDNIKRRWKEGSRLSILKVTK